MNIEEDVVVAKDVQNHRSKPTSNVFEDAELYSKLPPMRPTNNVDINDYEMIGINNNSYNFNNNTINLLSSNTTSANSNSSYNENDMLWTIIGPIIVIAFCIMGHRTHIPSSQYHRGAMIRQQAERIWAIQRVKTERRAIPVEKRKSQIDKSLRKMKVVSKCFKTGYCILAHEEEARQTDNIIESEEVGKKEDSRTTVVDTEKVKSFDTIEEALASASAKGIKVMSDSSTVEEEHYPTSPPATATATAPQACSGIITTTNNSTKCPETPRRAETRSLLSPDSEDLEDSDNTVLVAAEIREEEEISPSLNNINCYDFDDDEDVCPICLDNFEVGDTVMWSRYNHGSCSHAFHEDCLLQWLLEQRENECPTCRACFIADPTATTGSTSSTNETVSETETVATDEDTSDEIDGDGDIEEGKSRRNIIISEGGRQVDNDNDGDGDSNHCNDDGEATDQEQKDNYDDNDHVDDEDDGITVIIDEMEEEFTYIIAKGSVQRVPVDAPIINSRPVLNDAVATY